MKKRVVFLMTILLMGLVAPNVAAKAKQKTQINLVTIGDSLTEGVGDTTNQGGYEKRTAKLLQQTYHLSVKTTNYGKAGDRSDQILKRIKNNPSAIRVIKKADVIVMTAGGNDLQQALFQLMKTKKQTDVLTQLSDNQSDYQKQLTKLTDFVRETNRHAPLFLFGNYNPLYVYLANRSDLNQAVQLYNGINQKVITNMKDAYYVSIYQTLTFGQYQNKKAQKKLVQEADLAFQGSTKNKVVEKTLSSPEKEKNQYITEEDHYHPNDKGYDKMSQALVRKMLAHKKDWLYQ
ncbi:hydrolase [Weissella diestrammenae]|uniref:Hydrolase n=1 Tax=Weissella diestrammenae TaxID=1162633 RepID=A0A7G9T4X9_9LACO|nr:GDSL-type esterase/lipase family protein [Weissella diestrammenae]MCM0582873.1 hydrolase [Weissella diestrammenae]QNN75154.1 hydrolase [Weissella diestrammenae]